MTTCNRPTCHRQPHKEGKGYCAPHAYILGIFHPLVDATPAREHIQQLINLGATQAAIAHMADCDSNSINNILTGKVKNIRQAISTSITAIPLVPRRDRNPAIGYCRRIRALRAAGWAVNQLAHHTGLSTNLILRLSGDTCTWVTKNTADRIDAFWNAHAYDPVRPPTPRVAKYNWPKPMDWDDIDDPNEQPDTGFIGATGRTRYRAQVIANHYPSFNRAGDATGIHPKVFHQLTRKGQATVTPQTETLINRAYYQIICEADRARQRAA